jgi:hypothetical protein
MWEASLLSFPSPSMKYDEEDEDNGPSRPRHVTPELAGPRDDGRPFLLRFDIHQARNKRNASRITPAATPVPIAAFWRVDKPWSPEGEGVAIGIEEEDDETDDVDVEPKVDEDDPEVTEAEEEDAVEGVAEDADVVMLDEAIVLAELEVGAEVNVDDGVVVLVRVEV